MNRKLSRNEINNTIDEFMQNNIGKTSLNSDDKQEVKNMFDALMKDAVNVNKTEFEQKALIDDLMAGFSSGEDRNKLMRSHSSNKHMNYFDNMLYEGASDDISGVLNKYSISTEVLRGIKTKEYFDMSVTTDAGVIRLTGYINPSPDGGEKGGGDDFFIIRLNGKTIYQWDGMDFYSYIDEEDTINVPSVEEAEGQKTVKREKTVTKDSIIRKDYYYTKTGKLAVRITSNGKIIGGGLVK